MAHPPTIQCGSTPSGTTVTRDAAPARQRGQHIPLLKVMATGDTCFNPDSLGTSVRDITVQLPTTAWGS